MHTTQAHHAGTPRRHTTQAHHAPTSGTDAAARAPLSTALTYCRGGYRTPLMASMVPPRWVVPLMLKPKPWNNLAQGTRRVAKTTATTSPRQLPLPELPKRPPPARRAFGTPRGCHHGGRFRRRGTGARQRGAKSNLPAVVSCPSRCSRACTLPPGAAGLAPGAPRARYTETHLGPRLKATGSRRQARPRSEARWLTLVPRCTVHTRMFASTDSSSAMVKATTGSKCSVKQEALYCAVKDCVTQAATSP